jgi:hypothetical protein
MELLDAEAVADMVDKAVGGAGVEPDRASLFDWSAPVGCAAERSGSRVPRAIRERSSRLLSRVLGE